MPAYIFAQEAGRTGQAIDAVLCNSNALGFPDRRSNVPVRIRRISNQLLCVDGVAHGIISAVGENGLMTFIIEGTTKSIRNRERRAALAKALAQLEQLAATLTPLRASSEEPELATQGLQMLFDWMAQERESAEGAHDVS